MLSHLRFHRRGASTPSSPAPEHPPSFSPLGSNEQPQALDFPFSRDSNSTTPTYSHAPLLPSIAGVVSSESNSRCERRNTAGLTSDCRPQPAQRLSCNGDSGFIGGVALQNYRRDVQAQQATARIDGVDRAGNHHFEDNARNQNCKAQEVAAEASPDPQMKKVMSFSTPFDLKASHSSDLGRRPTGAGLPPETPVLLSNPLAAPGVETQRAKKGLPFLKNPMTTLLMRRRNNQSVPEVRSLPLKKDEAPAYDPRIRGTRVHDFSAPRKSREAHTTAYSAPQGTVDKSSVAGQQSVAESSSAFERISSEQHGVVQSADGTFPSQSSSTVKNISSNPSSSSVYSSSDQEFSARVDAATRYSRGKGKEGAIPGRVASVEATRESTETKTGLPSSSARSTRSRNKSLSEGSISAIPKHMKSTSSRFSFDMAGGAKQEKLLEERHRQRELERKTARDDGIADSRFDDFDEDAFDYDAMMDDGDLEEKIPGVNADFEHEDLPESDCADIEADPDDDQENFAGFVFQRTNPVSTLASPLSSGKTLAPRVTGGDAVGPAKSKDTPDASKAYMSAELGAMNQMDNCKESASESGIHDCSTNARAQLDNGDDLYYDDGMIGLDEDGEDTTTGNRMVLLETNAQPFDESIFDDDDTDQFGRPVPGAFQHAQSLRRAAHQPVLKREADSAPRMSAPTEISRCTTRTSSSADDAVHESLPTLNTLRKETGDASQPQDGQALDGGAKSIAAYQAALAAAAHRAAASGKFQRSFSSSSASCHFEDDQTSATDEQDEEGTHGYDDMDDGFDLDDDTIIAEANASALANDSDGWYGQEFGFYSAPPGAHATSHGAGMHSLKDYEYANGGFFGPGDTHRLRRSISGRMISREPNLTPITEKSEYSNRNSLMSLGYPPISTSTPATQSPGLAQLAMMGDSRDDNMTLSALLRLRTKAWGGSQASLSSSRAGSPRSDRGDGANSSWLTNPLGVVDGQSNHAHSARAPTWLAKSYDDEESDDLSASGSRTITMATAESDQRQNSSEGRHDTMQTWTEDGGIVPHESALDPPSTADDTCFNTAGESCPLVGRPRSNSCDGTGPPDEESPSFCHGHSPRGHRRQNSADSVSYIKEEESGETRWVLERRRTAESGEIEVLDRKVIEGRKI
ncbi:hypothetical protein E4U42_002131 [Claviceps africana]|uniref:Uncharacterized protein n=1 Tax=Claviceps africana TaxID=83212 RepID=A0A8K0NHP5_9HYPO|nr:hypothetical protein E4U42_002131 [Claviceps africana]